jgi:hypothetical protein
MKAMLLSSRVDSNSDSSSTSRRRLAYYCARPQGWDMACARLPTCVSDCVLLLLLLLLVLLSGQSDTTKAAPSANSLCGVTRVSSVLRMDRRPTVHVQVSGWGEI